MGTNFLAISWLFPEIVCLQPDNELKSCYLGNIFMVWYYTELYVHIRWFNSYIATQRYH